MTDGLGDLWRRAMDANVRYYQAWGRVATAYVGELGAALQGYTSRLDLPTITLPTTARSDSSVRPAADGGRTADGSIPQPGPRPAVVLEGAPGTTAEGAVLVENHLAHPVSAVIHAEVDGDLEIAVDPDHVDLAPGESAVVRVSTTIVERAAPQLELRGQLHAPDLVGTTVPLLVRVRPTSAGAIVASDGT